MIKATKKRKIIDFDTSSLIPPWEQKEREEAEKIKKLQEDYIEQNKRMNGEEGQRVIEKVDSKILKVKQRGGGNASNNC